MRLRPAALAAVVAFVVAIPFGAIAAIAPGDYSTPNDADIDADVTVGGGSTITSVTVDGWSGFAWDVETSDSEIEFLFITDSEDAAYAVSIEEDDGDVTVNVKEKDWDEDKIAQVLSDDDDDEGEREEKVEVCHNGMTLEIGADGVADHTDHGDTTGACAGGDDGPPAAEPEGRALGHDRDPEDPPGEHGRDNARDSGGAAHGPEDAPGRQDD